MKWFKHLTASRTDPDIGAIMDRFGYKGYFLFFRTLEIMSDEFSVENPARNEFSFKWFLSQFPRNIDRKTLVKFYGFCQNSLEKKRIIYSLNGKTISINFPKLKDLTDDYTSRVVRSKSEVSTNNVRSNSEKNPSYRNKNKEIRIKNIKKYSENHILLADLLIEKIKENDPKAKVPDVDSEQYFKWIDSIRLCVEQDERSAEEIKTAIEFSQGSDFWRGNILSASKLRKQMPTLLHQAGRGKPSQIGKSSYTPSKEDKQRQITIESYRKTLMTKYKPEIDKAKKAKDLDTLQGIEETIQAEVAQKSREI